MVLGDWNKLSDVNTLIDTGIDDKIIEHIMELSTGVGKKRVEQVILTHNHFDHTGGLKAIVEQFHPRVWALGNLSVPADTLQRQQIIPIGDSEGLIFTVSEHSSDSVSIYLPQEGWLFSGDTPLDIKTSEGSYTPHFGEYLEMLLSISIRVIFPGHGPAIDQNVTEMLRRSLENVKMSTAIKH